MVSEGACYCRVTPVQCQHLSLQRQVAQGPPDELLPILTHNAPGA